MSKDTSKLLSYVLRHAPESLGIVLDAGGWTSVEQLVAKAQQAGHRIDRATVEAVVAESDKKRFTLSEDGRLIRPLRATQSRWTSDWPLLRRRTFCSTEPDETRSTRSWPKG